MPDFRSSVQSSLDDKTNAFFLNAMQSPYFAERLAGLGFYHPLVRQFAQAIIPLLPPQVQQQNLDRYRQLQSMYARPEM